MNVLGRFRLCVFGVEAGVSALTVMGYNEGWEWRIFFGWEGGVSRLAPDEPGSIRYYHGIMVRSWHF